MIQKLKYVCIKTDATGQSDPGAMHREKGKKGKKKKSDEKDEKRYPLPEGRHADQTPKSSSFKGKREEKLCERVTLLHPILLPDGQFLVHPRSKNAAATQNVLSSDAFASIFD